MSRDDSGTRYSQPYSPPSGSGSASNNRGNGDGPFDPGNTPPLVFAFIAIGFIVFGLVIAIVYKKCRPPPNSLGFHHPRSSVPVRRPSVQKPKLWDVWIAPDRRAPDEERTNVDDWETFVVSRVSFVSVPQPADNCPSPYQRLLHTLILPTFVSRSNTSRGILRDPSTGKTPNTGCSSGDRRRIRASWSPS